MSFQRQGAMALDYQPVRYEGSLLRFRGPAADLAVPHIACLGGTETFGRFVPEAYPTRLQKHLDIPVSNLGVAGGGVDVILEDGAIRRALYTAEAVILQLPGAHALSNRFYSVHPRRNDRFVKASPALRALYRDVDFTEFHFTRHLLCHLKTISKERFAVVREELAEAWTARMGRLIASCTVPVHLLWLSRRRPDVPEPAEGIGDEPIFVTQAMVYAIAEQAASLSIVSVTDDTGGVATRGMFFSASEVDAARLLPGPGDHEAAAAALLSHLRKA